MDCLRSQQKRSTCSHGTTCGDQSTYPASVTCEWSPVGVSPVWGDDVPSPLPVATRIAGMVRATD